MSQWSQLKIEHGEFPGYLYTGSSIVKYSMLLIYS